VTRNSGAVNEDSSESLGRPKAPAGLDDTGPLGSLPRVSHRQLALEQLLDRWMAGGELPRPIAWLATDLGTPILIGRPEILWRASGLGRPGLIAQMAAPGFATRMAIAVEIPLAHAVVDRLLGFDRAFAESRLQLTPVEWGIWTFLFLRALDSFGPRPIGATHTEVRPGHHFSPGELTLDRVGPDSFDPTSLGSIVTVRWQVRVGEVSAAVRLWLPESLINLSSIAAGARPPSRDKPAERPKESVPVNDPARLATRAALVSSWRALAGVTTMSQGLKSVRAGGVLPLIESRLTGKPASPVGGIDLVLDLNGEGARFRIPARPVADSGGRLLCVESGPVCEPVPRDPTMLPESESKSMSQPQPPSAPASLPLDVPVTLTVELGRVNLTVSQVADLKAGDVVELNRHSRAPVELTSNGRLVARGELILIDTDLGVRVTNVFL
jgi:flagellar motor switch protein FliN